MRIGPLFVQESGSGPPVVLLHGFTGSGETLAEVAGGLRRDHRVLSVDLPGHGRAACPDDPAAWTLEACVEQLVAVLDDRGCARAHVVGYSMGGRVALGLAALRPERVASAVVVGASAGLEDPAARAARRASDEALADAIETDGVAAFTERWMANPLFASQRERRGEEFWRRARAQRRENRPEGLARSLRGLGTGAQPPLHAALEAVDVPVLLVVGADDAKFRGVADALLPRLRRGELCVLPDAGHAAHLENPAAFRAALRDFLARKENPVSSLDWKTIKSYEDIRLEKCDGVAKITIARPEVRNAFRPKTLTELIEAFGVVRDDPEVGVVLFTGEGPDAFCSGGDQRVRGEAGYVDDAGVARLNALDLQRVIRTLPKPVIALVAGYAIGGGHVLHLVCDLTIAAENARFGQTGPKVGSFDGGFGASYMARIVGQKKAREIWYLCQQYDAREALDMGLVNTVVPLEALEETGVAWARRILQHSPLAIRCLKSAFNADCDGQAGLQELAGNATLLFYMTEEAQEGRNAFLEKRRPEFDRFPWRP